MTTQSCMVAQVFEFLAVVTSVLVMLKTISAMSVVNVVLTVATNCGPESAAGGLGAGTGALGTGCSDEDDYANSDTMLASGPVDDLSRRPSTPNAYDQMQQMRENYRRAASSQNQPSQQSENPSSSPTVQPKDSNKISPQPSHDLSPTLDFSKPKEGDTNSGEANV